ncbi:hypothetical protein VNI00_014253 [Paramarasmius palmivorus]|uniref:F-box domain-containing protein n=1 Tax=Paramarasmius palmivorus TaxID=297713 RepID=A0AAW0BU77_9AGAR
MATVASIPPEILSSIFILVDVTEYTLHVFSQTQFRRTLQPDKNLSESIALRLGCVCRRWRDVALATPALWASLYVDLGGSAYAEGIVDGLKMHLERAKAHPLSVSLQYNTQSVSPTDIDDPDFGSLSIPSRLISLIFHRSDCIHHLALHFPYHYYGGLNPLECLSYFRGRVKNLRHLVLFTPDHGAVRTLEPFSDSSLISSVAITITDDAPAQIPRLPFSSLTEVVLGNAGTPQVVSLLSGYPNIRVAKFSLCGNKGPSQINSPLSLRYLETLHLGDVDKLNASSLACLLDALMMPALKTLSLEAYEQYKCKDTRFGKVPRILVHVAALAMRSSEIESLHLKFISTGIEDLILVLEKMPKLRTLDMVIKTSFGQPLTADLLRGLRREDILPRLRDLRLALCREEIGIEKGALEELLKCRMNRPPEYRLQSAYLQMKQSMVPILDLQRLREMQNEGLAVRVIMWQGKTEFLGYVRG